MEHEVCVPVPVERLRAALADPAQVARAVPGLQQDAGSEPVAGRLRVRAGGHTITYRGALKVTAREDGTYAVEGEATEARGTGAVKLALTVRLEEADGGTTLRFEGTASADGRITDLPAEAVTGVAVRLLNRFSERLGTGAGAGAGTAAGTGAGAGAGTPAGATPGETAPEEKDAEKAAADEAAPDAVRQTPEPAGEPSAVSETEVPPPGLDELGDFDEIDGVDDLDDLDGVDGPDDAEDLDDLDGVDEGEPPAEAAHARRTMIGRSAEEVDHAPPRGRYAPVPAPQTAVPHSTLRWAGPAAALVVASAIVVGRALRRRR
ncbi:SRPBCC family protein [Streptomyces sp. NPDC017936]|uniref:SRPBCC family protein n=1 Tax=Streptomyces sp. NPDC017936 TaxID=3365016 RepID=UPI0037B3C0F9